MKTVDLESLKQQLNAARAGTRDQQQAFLTKMCFPNNKHNEHIIKNEMNDDDLQWIVPLAIDLFAPSIDILCDGMCRKCYYWEEDFLDEDTGEIVTVLRADVIENDTVFTPDKNVINKIVENIKSSVSSLSTNELRQLYKLHISCEAQYIINNELYRRGDPQANKERGDLYQFGDVERGIFIDYNKAKEYYDRAGIEFDSELAARDNRYFSEHTECPEFATYTIEGKDAPAVKTLIQKLYKLYGEPTEYWMFLPLEIVMKTLVGSDAYIGYIQSVDKCGPNTIQVEFYGCSVDCLKYALLAVFPNLKVEIAEQN